ncbi:MAG: hypothetical protein ACRDS1_14130 [Pseudonocardiaceae bacterium]
MEITDRKLWERELSDHMRWHAGDLQGSLHAGSQAGAKPGLWLSVPMLVLCVVMVMGLTSAGWVIGLYFV